MQFDEQIQTVNLTRKWSTFKKIHFIFSLYPGLAPGPQGTGHPLATQFVQPYPQNLMQQTQQHHRALAAHQAASRMSGVQRASAGQQAMVASAVAAGAQGGQMMPPAQTNNLRTIELQEKRKLEQEKRRKAEEERAKAAKAKEEIFSAGLFDEPQKINSQDDQVRFTPLLLMSPSYISRLETNF